MASSSTSIIDPSTVAKFLSKKDSIPGKLKVKKSPKPKNEKGEITRTRNSGYRSTRLMPLLR
jgi:hypothetical protein